MPAEVHDLLVGSMSNIRPLLFFLVLSRVILGGPKITQRSTPEFVFTTVGSDPIRKSNFNRRYWKPAITKSGLNGHVFHDLRATAVALAIAGGAHPKAIQERLGHASINTTFDVYGHMFPSLDADIADRLDQSMGTAFGIAN